MGRIQKEHFAVPVSPEARKWGGDGGRSFLTMPGPGRLEKPTMSQAFPSHSSFIPGGILHVNT